MVDLRVNFYFCVLSPKKIKNPVLNLISSPYFLSPFIKKIFLQINTFYAYTVNVVHFSSLSFSKMPTFRAHIRGAYQTSSSWIWRRVSRRTDSWPTRLWPSLWWQSFPCASPCRWSTTTSTTSRGLCTRRSFSARYERLAFRVHFLIGSDSKYLAWVPLRY